MESTDERKYFKIGDVAEKFKVNPSLLRYWETQFEELKPLKTKGKERLYTLENIKLIGQIFELTKTKGYTLAGAKEILSSSKSKLEHQIEIKERLVKIKEFLEDLKKGLEES